jgi:hypothetical protein
MSKLPCLSTLIAAWLAVMMSAPATAAKIEPDKPGPGTDKKTERGDRDYGRDGRDDRSEGRASDVGGKAKKNVVKKAGEEGQSGLR